MRFITPASVVLASWLCTFALACSDAASPGAGGAAGTASGGAGAMTGGTSGVGGMSGGTGGMGGMSGGASGAGGMSGGTSGMSGASGGAGGTSGGAGGTSGGAGGMGEPAITECNGMPLGERAIAKPGPFAIGPEAAGLPPYWPTEAWQAMAPDALGFDAAKLEAALAFETQYTNTQALLVVRHGYVAAEEYFGGFSESTRHQSFSMAKSFTSGLIGILIEEGLITGPDELLCQYYPQDWDCADDTDPRSRITIAHAMNLQTGLQWEEDWRSNPTRGNDAFTFDILATALGREAVDEPGTNMRYSTGDPALLTGVFEGAANMSAYEYGQMKLFGPIGIAGVQWGQDSQGRTTTYAGLQATAREYAKYGYLYLHRGQWDGMQIVPADWVDFTTQGDAPCEDWYRYLWHQNGPVRLGVQDLACDGFCVPPVSYANLPPDMFFASGINGQFIFVVPSYDLVVVRLAEDAAGSEHWYDYARELMGLMLDAIP